MVYCMQLYTIRYTVCAVSFQSYTDSYSFAHNFTVVEAREGNLYPNLELYKNQDFLASHKERVMEEPKKAAQMRTKETKNKKESDIDEEMEDIMDLYEQDE
jgi:hypothetical protein